MAKESYTDAERLGAEALIEENYPLLVKIARFNRRRARFSDTMATSDILHESFLRLHGRDDWNSRQHFVRASTLAIRHVIVDHARRKLAAKRGAMAEHLPVEETENLLPDFAESPEQVVKIAALLERVEEERPRWARIVDARYFAGMSEEECAEALDLSARTVRREWAAARVWIAEELGVAT
ncbi:MAG: ECF-type sigma factor [Pseudomonadota bacterium]